MFENSVLSFNISKIKNGNNFFVQSENVVSSSFNVKIFINDFNSNYVIIQL